MSKPIHAVKHSRGDNHTWPGHTGNWGRWSDDRGTMNLLTPEATLRGIESVRDGTVYPISWPLHPNDGTNYFEVPAYEHEMMHVTDGTGFMQDAGDRIAARQHGLANTHIDALGHVGLRDKAFNGHLWVDVAAQSGLLKMDITAQQGIVTRGVLIDVPRLRGVSSLTAGEVVHADEIAQGLEAIQPGDAVLIRLGNDWRATLDDPDAQPDHNGFLFGLPGLHTDVVDLIAAYDGALIGTDCSADVLPATDPDFRGPIHMLTTAVYGMSLIHNLRLDQLSSACAKEDRWTFLFTVGPINLVGATGSLVSPLAVM